MDESLSIAELVNAIAPAVTGGLIALSGTILLFWLQQLSQRRIERSKQLDEAFDRLMECCALVSRTLRDRSSAEPFDRWQVFERGWRFSWSLGGRDQPVGEWAMHILVGTTVEVAATDRSSPDYTAKLKWAEENLNLAISFLDRWRRGKLKTQWFQEQLRKHMSDSPEPPDVRFESGTSNHSG